MTPKSFWEHRNIAEAAKFKKDYIPFLAGRPNRETIINNDDIMNLRITLETTKDVKEFISKI